MSGSGLAITSVPWLAVAIVLSIVIAIYNHLVLLRNRFKNAFSQIDVQLKRRYDLIPNLVETAKGYLKHERQTLEAVIQARNAAFTAAKGANPADIRSMESLMGAEGALAGAMSRFSMVMEAYPELQANQNILQVQEELASTENRIAFARQAYNDAVMRYNTKRESFPDNLLAGLFKFNEAPLWELEEASHRENVKISFD